MISSSLRNVYGDPAKVTPELVDLYFALAVRAGNRKALVARGYQMNAQGEAGEQTVSLERSAR